MTNTRSSRARERRPRKKSRSQTPASFKMRINMHAYESLSDESDFMSKDDSEDYSSTEEIPVVRFNCFT